LFEKLTPQPTSISTATQAQMLALSADVSERCRLIRLIHVNDFNLLDAPSA